jgi:hypothetical protein
MSSEADDYDKLTPEQREVKDKADRERERQEQAGAACSRLARLFC